jgi:ADP-ribosylglycohydrolase
MRTRKQLLSDKKLLVERAQGCMAAVAVGDAMGDLGRSDDHRRRYGIVTEMYSGAASTDDTEFAVLTAKTILDSGGVLTHDSVEAAWRRYIIDAGGMLNRGGRPLYGAVENLRRGLAPPQSGIDNVLNNDDGAAMRIASIGVVYAGDPAEAARTAGIDAQISHCESGVWAAQAVAAAVAVAMVDGTPDDVENAMFTPIPADTWLGRAMDHARTLRRTAGGILDVWDALHTDFYTLEHAVVEEALPQVYGVSMLTDLEYRNGMFWATNFGRDADTIAAIVGAIAGARHGLSAIPDSWIAPVRRPSGTCLRFSADEDMIEIGTELAELAIRIG